METFDPNMWSPGPAQPLALDNASNGTYSELEALLAQQPIQIPLSTSTTTDQPLKKRLKSSGLKSFIYSLYDTTDPSADHQVLFALVLAIGARTSDHPLLVGANAPSIDKLPVGTNLTEYGKRRESACKALEDQAIELADRMGTLRVATPESMASLMLLESIIEQEDINHSSVRPFVQAYAGHARSLLEKSDSVIAGTMIGWTAFIRDALKSAGSGHSPQFSDNDVYMLTRSLQTPLPLKEALTTRQSEDDEHNFWLLLASYMITTGEFARRVAENLTSIKALSTPRINEEFAGEYLAFLDIAWQAIPVLERRSLLFVPTPVHGRRGNVVPGVVRSMKTTLCNLTFMLNRVVGERISAKLESRAAPSSTGIQELEPRSPDSSQDEEEYWNRLVELRKESYNRAFLASRLLVGMCGEVLKQGISLAGNMEWLDPRAAQHLFVTLPAWLSVIVDTPTSEEGGPPGFTFDAKLQDLQWAQQSLYSVGWASERLTRPVSWVEEEIVKCEGRRTAFFEKATPQPSPFGLSAESSPDIISQPLSPTSFMNSLDIGQQSFEGFDLNLLEPFLGQVPSCEMQGQHMEYTEEELQLILSAVHTDLTAFEEGAIRKVSGDRIPVDAFSAPRTIIKTERLPSNSMQAVNRPEGSGKKRSAQCEIPAGDGFESSTSKRTKSTSTSEEPPASAPKGKKLDPKAREEPPRVGRQLRHIDDIRNLFKSIPPDRSEFAGFQSFSDAPNPCLEVEGFGGIGLPLAARDVELLKGIAKSLKENSASDGTRWQLPASLVKLANPKFEKFIHETVRSTACSSIWTSMITTDIIFEMLVLHTPSSAPSTFVGMEPGSHPGAYAHVALSLPGIWTGGSLNVSLGPEDIEVGSSGAGELQTSASIWHSLSPSRSALGLLQRAHHEDVYTGDTDHLLSPLISGHRITLLYSLVRNSSLVPRPTLFNTTSHQSSLEKILATWLATPQSLEKVVVVLDSYTPLTFENLLYGDKTKVDLLWRAAQKAGFDVFLAPATVKFRKTWGTCKCDTEIKRKWDQKEEKKDSWREERKRLEAQGYDVETDEDSEDEDTADGACVCEKKVTRPVSMSGTVTVGVLTSKDGSRYKNKKPQFKLAELVGTPSQDERDPERERIERKFLEVTRYWSHQVVVFWPSSSTKEFVDSVPLPAPPPPRYPYHYL
ncbi:hypothetical protein P7C70_g7139, partial [Phenoliferia sp. Uapishka_3]